jgi:hypothetical protein
VAASVPIPKLGSKVASAAPAEKSAISGRCDVFATNVEPEQWRRSDLRFRSDRERLSAAIAA